jgi:hypothetical protein
LHEHTTPTDYYVSNKSPVTSGHDRIHRTAPIPESCWRAIVLLGQNTASYKFALAQSLFEFSGRQQEQVTLEELAEPFSRHVFEHLKLADRQSTGPKSRFLDICRRFNKGELSQDELISGTVRTGFRYVLDAFHVIGAASSPVQFFLQEGSGRNRAIRLTEDMLRMAEAIQYRNLSQEVEARWRLVETAWEMGISARVLLLVTYESLSEQLVLEGTAGRRRPVTSARDAIGGYQKGRCFYCGCDIDLAYSSQRAADVDHFIERHLQHKLFGSSPNLDGVWNLVLACVEYNRGSGGKVGRVPGIEYLERLHQRNEFYIISHHPLREAMILQTGTTEERRRSFLNDVWSRTREWGFHTWRPPKRRYHLSAGGQLL